MSILGAALVLLVAVLVVGSMIVGLIVRLRDERAGQSQAARSSWAVLMVVALGVSGVLGAVAWLAGWQPAAVFRVALAGLVVASVIGRFGARRRWPRSVSRS